MICTAGTSTRSAAGWRGIRLRTKAKPKAKANPKTKAKAKR